MGIDNFSDHSPTLVIIGGGITGAGIARDASQRGFRVTLIEQDDMGSGTSGHFHGILHSGARYAVNHPSVAAECYQENQIIRRIAPSTITDTGGLFIALNDKEATHADTVIAACQAAGIPTVDIPLADLAQREPNISKAAIRAFSVPDAFVNGASLIQLNMQAAANAAVPATFLTHHTVTALTTDGHTITSVTCHDDEINQTVTIPSDYVINACGVWAGNIAKMAGIELPMIYDKGTMINLRPKLSTAVLNRCRPEADGDLLVPSGKGSIMGTTARVITSLDQNKPSKEEIDVLIEQGTQMVPSLKQATVSSIYSGVRPLLDSQDIGHTNTSTRAISRSFHVVDHQDEGIDNFISVIGGKVTVYRRMAEVAVDLLCRKSDVSASCQTATTPL